VIPVDRGQVIREIGFLHTMQRNLQALAGQQPGIQRIPGFLRNEMPVAMAAFETERSLRLTR
jgi:hypothetical protein